MNILVYDGKIKDYEDFPCYYRKFEISIPTVRLQFKDSWQDFTEFAQQLRNKDLVDNEEPEIDFCLSFSTKIAYLHSEDCSFTQLTMRLLGFGFVYTSQFGY